MLSLKNAIGYDKVENKGIPITHSQSYYFMNDNLFNHININKENSVGCIR